MKKYILIALGILTSFLFWPQSDGQSQDTPTITLASSLIPDSVTVDPRIKALLDTLQDRDLQIITNIDTATNYLQTAKNKKKGTTFRVTDYEPPVSVLKLRFRGRTEYVRVDSQSQLLITEKVVYDN